MKNKLLLATTVLAASSFLALSANANPIYVGYSLNGGSTITSIGTSGSDQTAGTGGTTVTAGNFSIQIAATGQTPGSSTSLFSNTITISSAGGGTISLYASEINNSFAAGTFTTGFGNNSLSAATVTETSLLGLANSVYSTTSPYILSSATVAPGQAMGNSTVNAPGNLPSQYSLTEIYTVTFGASGGRVDANIGVVSTAAAVPEPVSISLLGAGLVGLGFVRLRRRA